MPHTPPVPGLAAQRLRKPDHRRARRIRPTGMGDPSARAAWSLTLTTTTTSSDSRESRDRVLVKLAISELGELRVQDWASNAGTDDSHSWSSRWKGGMMVDVVMDAMPV